MKKTKKVLLTALSYVLVVALAIMGTIAYLMSTDSDVNVMTMGNVKIEQHEYEREVDGNGNYTTDTIDNQTSYVLKEFEQGKELLPIVGDPSASAAGWDDTTVRMSQVDSYGGMQVFAGKNAQDKFVTVENTGKSDAYIRTLVAIEVGSTDGSLIGTSYHKTWTKNEAVNITIDGNQYMLIEYTYKGGQLDDGSWRHEKGILPAGDTSYPNLSQVYLKSVATNEDCEDIDGNDNGMLDILVLSQAVQADGFDNAQTALDTAFGKVSEKAAEWFGAIEKPVVVSSAKDLSDALQVGGEIILSDDVTITSTMIVPANTTSVINLGGNNLSYAVSNSGASAIINNKGDLTIEGKGELSYVAENPDMQAIPSYATNTITNTGKLTIGKGVVVKNGSDGGASYAVDVQSGEFILDGGTLIGKRCALRVARFNADTKFVMNDGRVEGATPAWIHLPGSNANDAPKIDVTINGGIFKSTKATSADNDVLYTYSFGNSHANTNVTINGGEFLGGTVSIGSGYKGDAPILTINGGTFEYDVLQWLENDGSNVLYSANK